MSDSRRVQWSALAAALAVVVALLGGASWLLALGGLAALATAGLAWRAQGERAVPLAAGLAAALVAAQGVAPPALGWGSGLVAVALLVVAAGMARWRSAWQEGNRAFRLLALGAALGAYGSAQLTFFGTQAGAPAWLPLAERGALAALGLVIFVGMRRALARQHQPATRRLALATTLAYCFDLALALSPAWAGQPAAPAARLGASAALWALLVALWVAASRLPNRAPAPPVAPLAKRPLPRWRVALNDVLILMKVRVASLLLLTTLGAMVIAAQGWPGWALVGWVMLGGTLSVGGAGALNHFFDRDIDGHMGRTSQRPIPAGRVAPWQALALGLALSALQFALFWFGVNPLSAWLSTGGLLYYVFLYTLVLKRRSPQNIVVGGAAGAFPPLVGWAAVTGDLSLGALYLFAIIFYWTPPHFWALALLRRGDYERAGVPMLPVVHGEAHTRLQIVLYSILMVTLTLMLVPLQLMGLLYLVAALALNARFLWDVVRLYRQPGNGSALTLYKFSLLYLALLFAAMAVDRALLA